MVVQVIAKPSLPSLRRRVFKDLCRYLGPQQMQGAMNCAASLYTTLQGVPTSTSLRERRIFLAYGGGKDSSYLVAFVRLVQLLLLQKHGTTFPLRIATNRHAGMPQAVLENMDRVYRALGLADEPDTELLLIDEDEVHPFSVDRPLPDSVRQRNRLDLLMTGHRCYGAARPTFCNACNFSMVNSFGVALAYGDEVDLIMTGDSPAERRAYCFWVQQIARELALPKTGSEKGFLGFLQVMNQIAQDYFADIYRGQPREIPFRRVKADGITRVPRFFSIYPYTAYRVADHWKLLTEFLGFQFDEVAFQFTESDCGNPGLMAHLRGLKVEHLYGRSYDEGLAEYLQFALPLMRQKDFPESLMAKIHARYSTPAAILAMRAKLDRYARETFDLTETQLVCMLSSPFAEKGKHLETFLVQEQPTLRPFLREIHLWLAAEHTPPLPWLAARLCQVSGLSSEQLRALYQSKLISSEIGPGAPPTPISIILQHDPHQSVIQTKHSPEGPWVTELISGR